MKTMIRLTLIAVVGLFLTACQSEEKKEPKEEGMELPQDVQEETEGSVSKAFVVLNPTEGNHVVGAVTFTSVDKGIRIIGDIGGLPPGDHGFRMLKGKVLTHDLGPLTANHAGFAHYDRIDHEIALNGSRSILGQSIVIDADEPDSYLAIGAISATLE